jgi:NADH/F420H2 dehydrogenase subunit C
MKPNFKTIKNIIPLISIQLFNDEVVLNVTSHNLLKVLQILKNHVNYQFTLLSCISGVDLLRFNYRFSVCYELLSLLHNVRLRVKIFIDERNNVNSVKNIYINSDWFEREIWDLYGIFFENHDDLRRILTDYGFEGHPLRKDFPLSGYVESRYSEKKKRVIVEPLQLTQEYRFFNFDLPWL